MADAFISYRRQPSASLAMLIQEKLKNQHKVDAYLDTTRRDSTQVQFPERLMQAIEDAPVFICLLGDSTLESEWVLKEIRKAHELGKFCIPIFQESYELPQNPEEAVQYLLSHDGVHIFNIRNVYIDAGIREVANLIPGRSLSSTDITSDREEVDDTTSLQSLGVLSRDKKGCGFSFSIRMFGFLITTIIVSITVFSLITNFLIGVNKPSLTPSTETQLIIEDTNTPTLIITPSESPTPSITPNATQIEQTITALEEYIATEEQLIQERANTQTAIAITQSNRATADAQTEIASSWTPSLTPALRATAEARSTLNAQATLDIQATIDTQITRDAQSTMDAQATFDAQATADSLTPTIAPTNTLVSPCFVRATEANVPIQVGTGNRAVRGSMPINQDVIAVGKHRADDETLWFRIQPPNYDPLEADRYWVARDDVQIQGDCDAIPDVPDSILVPANYSAPDTEGGGTASESQIAGVDCSGLALLYPLFTVDAGNHRFSWRGATGDNLTYELVFYNTDGNQVETFRTMEKSYFLNLGAETSTGGRFKWEVRVYQNGNYACVSASSPRIPRTDAGNSSSSQQGSSSSCSSICISSPGSVKYLETGSISFTISSQLASQLNGGQPSFYIIDPYGASWQWGVTGSGTSWIPGNSGTLQFSDTECNDNGLTFGLRVEVGGTAGLRSVVKNQPGCP